MLNICIPAFNYDVSNLVKSLHEQCRDEKIEFSILIYEDGSDIVFVKLNKSLTSLPQVSHFVCEVNKGRSAARNFLISKTEVGKILFIDCDSIIPDKNYIKKYIEHFDKTIVCGGTIYQKSQKTTSHELRYKYGLKREMTSAYKRNISPNKSFATNNFLASKELFNEVSFRDFLKQYGHEDSLLGFELLKKDINIFHIDNPVIHNGIESNEVFLNKTNEGLKNLIIIEKSKDIDSSFTQEIRIVNNYLRLKKICLVWLPYLIFKIFKNNILKHLLVSKNPILRIFDLYKFGYYCELKKINK
ncbi:MAG TPA: glycosyltransferase [Bacteroidales bacterium]|nr:glycosyltransferase [Bacteroidales bacterium]